MAVRRGDDVDFSKSTGAFPMPPSPAAVVFQDSEVDFAASTGAYPMHDDTTTVVGRTVEHVVEHVGSEAAEVRFVTPGPVSLGDPAEAAIQRKELGLDPVPLDDQEDRQEDTEHDEDGPRVKVIAPPATPTVHQSAPGRARRK